MYNLKGGVVVTKEVAELQKIIDNHGMAELDAAGFIRAEENDKRTYIKNS